MRMLRLLPAVIACIGCLLLPTSLAIAETVQGTVTLSPSGTFCTMDVSGNNLSFGNWVWDGSNYQPDAIGSNEASFSFNVIPPSPGVNCRLTIESFSNLVGPGSGNQIYLSSFSIKIDNGSFSSMATLTPHPFSYPYALQGNPHTITLRLDSVDNTLPTGTYTGQFVFTLSPE